jgi:hypothetical protein
MTDLKADISVFISEVQESQAPVTLKVALERRFKDAVVSYRWYKNQFWAPRADHDDATVLNAGDEKQICSVFTSRFYNKRLEECEADLEERAASLLFISGTLFEQVLEPYYEVSSSYNWTSIEVQTYEWKPSRHTFSANDWGLVIQYAIDNATDKELAEFEAKKNKPLIEILMPETIKIPRRADCVHQQIKWHNVSENTVTEAMENGEMVVTGICQNCGGNVEQRFVPFFGISLAPAD